MSKECRLKFWGVRGSIPTPGPTTLYYGGNTSCLELRADGEIIILDAGTGIRLLGQSLAAEFAGKSLNLTLLISHTHWAHIQGFPFFLPAYNAANKIRIIGFEGARAGLATTFAGQMESPYFPIELGHMPGTIVIEERKEFHFKINKVSIQACFLNHPGLCVGYRINTSAGSIVYLPDNEPYVHRHSIVRRDGRPESPPLVLEKKLIEFVSGADVLIVDSQYDEEEYKAHVGWGHGCVRDAVNLAIRGGVRNAFLFHHDPNHDDERITGMVEHARELVAEAGAELEVDAAREGLELILG